MDLPAHRRNERITVMGVALLAAGIALYGLYLVVVGVEWTIVREVPLGDPPGARTSQYLPAYQGLVPLIAGALVVLGVTVHQPLLAWAGAMVVAVFSVLFLFGVGGILIPFAAALLVLLAVMTWLHFGRTVRDTAMGQPRG
jgi:hypothetical protein